MNTMTQGILVLSIPIVVAFIVWVLLIIFSRMKRSGFPNRLRSDDLFLKTVKQRNRWFSMSMLWLIVEYLGVIIPFLSSCMALLVNVFCENTKESTVLYSFVSMSIVVFIFAINPRKHAKGYRIAYIGVEETINRSIKEKNDQEKLIQALDDGEKAISEGFDLQDGICRRYLINKQYGIAAKSTTAHLKNKRKK